MRLDIHILKKIFPSILFNMGDKNIHLTFDDGPNPIATPIVLKELKVHNIKATFFLLGQNVQKFPDLVSQIHSEGHQIGNHSFTHSNLLLKKNTFLLDEILRTSEILKKITGIYPKYFRPPYGYIDFKIMKLLRKQGLTCVLWDVDSKDYKFNSITNILRRVVLNTSYGAILLFHDNDLTSQRVATYLPVVLDTLLRKEFTFKTLPI